MKKLILLLTFAASCLLADRLAQASDLQKQLLREAPKIHDYCREKGYKNIGVLKFRVKKGSDPISDNVGTLNMQLANQLEVALTLSNSNDPAKQLGIIRRASSAAAKIPGANHVSAEGRAKLFDAEYPLSWGDAKVKPDAFITGVVLVSADLREMTVGIMALDKNGGPLEKVMPVFRAPTDAASLSEIGESFVLRGAFDKSNLVLASAKAVEQAAKVKAEPEPGKTPEPFPLEDKAAPVTMEVLYDGKVQPVEIKDGKALIAEPEEHQEVKILVKRAPGNRQRLGIVVKVNGENTLFREKLRDIDCRKWILEPDKKAFSIGGYQSANDMRENFRVASREESKSKELDYGEDVGTITITVFGEKTSDAPPADLPSDDPEIRIKNENEAEDLAALTRSVFPIQPVRNLAALKHQLREAGRETATRGLIMQGASAANKINIVTFKADPTPLMAVTVTYYKK